MEPKRSGTAEYQVFDGMNLDLPIPTKKTLGMKEMKQSRLGGNRPAGRTRTIMEGGSMTITWFHSLSLYELENVISFPESLMLVNDAGSTVGKYYCTVKKSILMDEPCFLVHFGSCCTLLDGFEVGISVTGFIDYNLHPIQEFTHEWVTSNGKSVERRFILIREENRSQFYAKNAIWDDGALREEQSFTINIKDMTKVVTESANMIFQRIIILQNKSGEIDLRTLTSKGTTVRANFRTLGNGYENIRGQEMRVWGIRRTIFDGKNVEEWDSIFNDHARMVLRCQPDKDHALIPLWFKAVEKYGPTGDFVGTRPPLVWACDMELYAQYLERRDLVASQNKAYIMNHPKVRALLADFLQALLQKKPCRVVEFGKHYFEPYLRKQIVLDLAPTDSDSDEERPTCPLCDETSYECTSGSHLDETEPEPETLEVEGEAEDHDLKDYFEMMKEVTGEVDILSRVQTAE